MASIRLKDSKSEILELTFTGGGEPSSKLRFVMCDCAPTDIVAQILALDNRNRAISIQRRMDIVESLVVGKNWGVVAKINSYTLTGDK